MTEENQAIEAVEETVEAVNESEVIETSDDDAVDNGEQESHEETEETEQVFPKKAVNALNRKNKTITKLRAQMRDLEAKMNATPEKVETKDVNADDFYQFGDYMTAQVESLVEKGMTQAQQNADKVQFEQQKQELTAQRDQYIREQATEVTKTFADLPQVWSENEQLLNSLPNEVTDIFYSIDNAPAAIYTLAKEGKLESLVHMNPNIAAYEIVNAQNRGMELLSKPSQRVSQTPTPIQKVKGTGTIKKPITTSSNVLESLGLK